MREHKLKTWPAPFQLVWDGVKTYEIRVNDRDFGVGDRLRLLEFQPEDPLKFEIEGYSGRWIRAEVTCMTPGGTWGLPAGMCVLGIRVVERSVEGGVPCFCRNGSQPHPAGPGCAG